MSSELTQTQGHDDAELLSNDEERANHIATKSIEDPQTINSVNSTKKEYIDSAGRNILSQIWFARVIVLTFTLNVLMFLISFPFTINSTVNFNGKLATIKDRPFAAAPYFAGNDFYQEFGEWYGSLVVSHVTFATLATIILFGPLFITRKGNNPHQLYGMITVTFIALLYTFGNINITILTATRGYNPCAYFMEDDITTQTQTSFNFMNFLNLSYFGPYLAEITTFGMIHAIYGKNQIEHDKYNKICLSFLSLASIFFNISRIIILLSIIISASNGSFSECGDFDYFKSTFTLITFISEAPSSILSYWNFRCILFGKKRKLHGRNMVVMSAMMVWTLLANIFFKIWSFGTVIAYIFIIIAVYIYCVEWIQNLCKKIIEKAKNMTKNAN